MRSGINSFCQTQQTNPQWRHTSLKEKKPVLDVRLVWKKTQGSILSSGITKLQNFLGFFFSIFLGGSEIVVIYKTLLKKCQISVNCYVITVEPVKDIFGSDTQTVLNWTWRLCKPDPITGRVWNFICNTPRHHCQEWSLLLNNMYLNNAPLQE